MEVGTFVVILRSFTSQLKTSKSLYEYISHEVKVDEKDIIK